MFNKKKEFILDATFLSINSTAFAVEKIKIQKGQSVTLQLRGINNPATKASATITELAIKPVWFANNDQVLDIADHTAYATIKALKVGTSRIDIFVGEEIIRQIDIEVISGPATSVKIIVGKAVPK